MHKSLKTLLVAAIVSTAAVGAFSQNTPGSADHSPMGHGKSGMHHMDPTKMEKMVTKRLDDLKAKLQITAVQEPAWTAFTTAMKPAADMAAMGKHPDMAAMVKLPLPERMDAMRKVRKERMAMMDVGMDKREDAAKALYAVLSAEQKVIADAEHAKLIGGRHGKGRM